MIAFFRPILLVFGALLSIMGAAMFLPAIVDLMHGNRDWEVFTFSGSLALLFGLGLFAAFRNSNFSMTTRQAFFMTCAAWAGLSAVGALPYYFSGIVPTYADAYFESMSGITTTGATVIEGLDHAPPGILLWRGIEQWLGGLGIVVMAVAVLPMLQVGGMQLFKIEAFDTAEKILPRATQISGSLTLVFISLTGLCALAYFFAGMRLFDAVIHAMTTVATGGFSTKDASIEYFDSTTIEVIAIFFMIMGSIPFILFVQIVQGRPSKMWRNSQVRFFLAILTVLTLIAWSMHPESGSKFHNSLVEAAFSVITLVTGTGFTIADYDHWHIGSNAFFFIIMFIGGCAGSTSCGIKIFRFQIMIETVKQHLSRVFFPNSIYVMRFSGKKVNDSVSQAVMNFFAIYFLLFGLFAIALTLTGLDFTTSMSAAGTTISNVGPGLGDVIGPSGSFKNLNQHAKWILSASMLTGRLELFTVLVLFMPRFWRG